MRLLVKGVTVIVTLLVLVKAPNVADTVAVPGLIAVTWPPRSPDYSGIA